MGKVHGSLARAGKVRAQTPKVATAEKAKEPVGRAKKRILYNDRFVAKYDHISFPITNIFLVV